MNETGSQSDPSMDEILASIRRIIAEEEGETSPQSQPAQAAQASDTSAPPQDVPSEAVDSGSETREEPEDVLDLTEEVEASGSESETREEAEDVLDLTEEVQDETEVFELSDDMIEEPAEQVAEAVIVETQDNEAPLDSDDAEPSSAVGEDSSDSGKDASFEDSGSLMSAETEEKAMEALRAAMAAPSTASGDQTDTPEVDSDEVKAVMAPMVRQWLDQNLPALVERVVREEVSRLVRRSQQDD